MSICYVLELSLQPLRHRCDTRRHNSVTGKTSQGRHSQCQESCFGPPRSCQSFPKIGRGSLRHYRDTVATPLRHLTGNFRLQSRLGGTPPAIPSRRLRQCCDLMAATLLRPGLCDKVATPVVTGASHGREKQGSFAINSDSWEMLKLAQIYTS